MQEVERLRWLRRAEESVAAVLLALVFLSIALQVITRFILRDPLFWTEEAARYLFVWLVAIGSAEVIRARSHIAMDVFVLMLPTRSRLFVGILLNSVIVFCLGLLAWYGFFGMLRAHRVMSVAVGVPESLLYGALPVGAVLMALRMLFVIAQDVSLLRHPERAGVAGHDTSERYL